MKKVYKWLLREESGDIAIEAMFGLIIFILTYMGVLMFGMLMRLEASTQYAVDQVSKEIAQYYYIVERADLLPDSPPEQLNIDSTNQLVVNIQDFDENVGKANDAINDFGAFFDSGQSDLGDIQNRIETLKDDGSSVIESGKSIYSTLKNGDWDEQIKNILTLTLKSGVDRLFGQYIAGPICKLLYPKYLPADDVDAYLKAYGIENGMDDMDFSCSTFIQDGYSINVVLRYKVNLKALTFGLYDEDIYIKQVGGTQAWISYKDDSNKMSIWSIASDVNRGKTMVDHIEDNGTYGKEIDKSNIGFDTYDESSQTLTEIHSTNIYKSERFTTKDENGQYTLNSKNTQTYLRNFCNKALNHIPKANEGKVITVDGKQITLTGNEKHQVVITFPVEAQSEFGAELESIRKNLQADYNEVGLEVKFSFVQEGKSKNISTNE